MGNPKGVRGEAFTRLQRDTAVRIVEEEYGGVNSDAARDRIKRQIGRMPTRQAVDKWLRKARGNGNRVDNDPSDFIATPVHFAQQPQQMQQPAQQEPVESEPLNIDELRLRLGGYIRRALDKAEKSGHADVRQAGILLDKWTTLEKLSAGQSQGGLSGELAALWERYARLCRASDLDPVKCFEALVTFDEGESQRYRREGWERFRPAPLTTVEPSVQAILDRMRPTCDRLGIPVELALTDYALVLERKTQ